jgi:succinate dehydrogenase hydrophobic membrane anchor protein
VDEGAHAVLVLLSVLYHAWIGVRDIYMDYVKPVGVRLALQVGTIVLALAAPAARLGLLEVLRWLKRASMANCP